ILIEPTDTTSSSIELSRKRKRAKGKQRDTLTRILVLRGYVRHLTKKLKVSIKKLKKLQKQV
ncbi:hypothetical protein N7449_006131, partial [Penicillium cf. viridicatum]